MITANPELLGFKKYLPIIGGWVCARTPEGEEIVEKAKTDKRFDAAVLLKDEKNFILVPNIT